MLKYKYVNKNYKTKIGVDGKALVLSYGHEIEVEDNTPFANNPDFELISGKVAEEPQAELSAEEFKKKLESQMESMGWKAFQKYARDKYGCTDTSKDDLIEEIMKKVGGN